MSILTRGQRLGVYVVDGLLGEGGMAEVYRATHQTLGREVAIKVLNPVFSQDPTFPLRFRREAKASARLNHPNIVTVYDFDEKGEIAYLVMELAGGGTLAERSGQLATLGEVVSALGPVFEAVEYAHTRGIVHRDIKPDNVLLTDDQRPLLADFGLARIQSESLDISDIGLILGTPYYMAPEQVLAEDVDPRADVYALGILTYAFVTGRVPFDGPTFSVIAHHHLKSPPPSILAALPDAPASLDAAVARATAKGRADRFASVAEFYRAVERSAAEAPDLPVGRRAPGRFAPGDVRHAEAAPPAQAESLGRSPQFRNETGVHCAACRSDVRPGVRFCTACGHQMPELAEQTPARTVAAANAPHGVPPAQRRQRASSFTRGQWASLALAALAVLAINGIGLWLTRAGRSAADGSFATRCITFIYDNLGWFKSGMALVALTLAGMAAWAMWAAVVDPRRRAPQTYRRLRQYHRLMGYAATVTAFSIGVLTCVGIFGFDLSTTRRTLHTVMGTALLLALTLKIGVVRFAPPYRRYLNMLGMVVFLFYTAAVATSAAPWAWQELTGAESNANGSPYSNG